MILESISDEIVSCRFELDVDISVRVGKAIDGTPVKYKYIEPMFSQFGYNFRTRNKEYIKTSITNVIEFNFCFSTDDSDFIQFDPYIEYVRKFIKFDEIDKLAKKISFDASRKFRTLDIKSNDKDRENKIREHYNNDIEECKKNTIKHITEQIYYIPNYWSKNIAETFTNAMISKTILSQFPQSKKTCPHINR